MKTLIYTHEFVPYAGGVATYNYELAKGLSELGQEVVVLAPKYSSDDIILDQKMPFKVVRANLSIDSVMQLNGNIVKLPASAYRFIKVLRRSKPDRVLITSAVAHESAALARLFYPFRFALTVHGTEIYMHFVGGKVKQRSKSRLMKSLFHKADRIICVSSFTESLLNERVGLPKKQTTVIRNGIDSKTLLASCNKHKNQEICKKLKLQGNRVLLTVGRLTPRKGQDIVIETLPEVIKEIPEVKYVIVGTGNYRQSLEKILQTKELSDKVIFAGRVSKESLPSYYELCNIFIMLSRRERHTVEGLGISFLEAMAFNKPLIGGDHGGVPEIIEDGKNGYLVDPLNISSAADAICRLLKDRNLAKNMGEAGRKKLEREFSRQAMAQKTLDLLL